MITEISIAIIALAFVALVIYVITLIQEMKKLTLQVNHTLIQTRTNLNDVSHEVKKIMVHTSAVSEDLQKKVEAFNPLFKALENVGHALEQKSNAYVHQPIYHVKRESIDPSLRSSGYTKTNNNVTDLMDLISVSLRLWQKLKQRR
jgi:uncharacterized protein YoxC